MTYKKDLTNLNLQFILSKKFCEENELPMQYYFLNKYLVKFQKKTDTKKEKTSTQLVFISSNQNDDKYISYLNINKDKLGFSHIFQIDKDAQLLKINLQSNFLAKRLNMIFKAQKLKTFGIIVTNPKMENFKELFAQAKSILKKSEKRHYTFIMNKVNETKLRNFPDIQAFVMISCPFSSFLECIEFKLPIFSIQELQLFDDICKIDRVNIIDYKFNTKTTGGSPKSEEKTEKEELEELKEKVEKMEIDVPKMQVPMINEDWVDLRRLDQEQKMMLYRQDSELVLSSFYKHYEYFRDKNWKGLEADIDVPVQKARMGEVGIPLSYNQIKK